MRIKLVRVLCSISGKGTFTEIFHQMIFKKPAINLSLAISFVNNSISPNAFTNICARFAVDMEKNSSGKAYELMNTGYRRLSFIAYHVSTKEDVFALISQAFGSMQIFFHFIERERLSSKHTLKNALDKEDIFEGIILSISA